MFNRGYSVRTPGEFRHLTKHLIDALVRDEVQYARERGISLPSTVIEHMKSVAMEKARKSLRGWTWTRSEDDLHVHEVVDDDDDWETDQEDCEEEDEEEVHESKGQEGHQEKESSTGTSCSRITQGLEGVSWGTDQEGDLREDRESGEEPLSESKGEFGNKVQ